MSDAELLSEYARRGAESAFAELVARHADLVYSAALRQVNSPDLARDVAQSVFAALAQGARSLDAKLEANASLAGWLCRATRNISLNLKRDEFRRYSRERQAMQELELSREDAPDWDRVRPILDETLSELGESDHDALVLRYFRNCDLREVGLAFGVSEDTAQKRVSRALEKLRGRLSRRGITTSSAALAAMITANAVQPPPVGLIASISASAGAAGIGFGNSTAIAATKAIAMTTVQKTLIAAVLAAAIGAGTYEMRQDAVLRQEIRALREQNAREAGELQRQLAGAMTRVALLTDENAELKRNSAEVLKLRGEVSHYEKAARTAEGADDSTRSAANAWLERVSRLKQRLEQSPESGIPELQLLSEQDWLNAAKGELNTDADYRRALSSLRGSAEGKVAKMLQSALKAYLQAANGQFPNDLSQLQPYFDTPIDEAILRRWEIAPAKTVGNLVMGGDVIITQKAPVDAVFDARYGIGPSGWGSTDFLSANIGPVMEPVWKAYKADHGGAWPANDSQLLPYATTPEQQAAVQNLILRDSGSK